MSERNQSVMKHFPPENSWEDNYRIIIELGQKLPAFDERDKQSKWLIKACQSPLWLKADINKKGRVVFTGDSDALITKGLLALIIEFYTQKEPEEILKDRPIFIEKLDLSQFLSSRRTNGLQAILDQILQYARAFLLLSKPSGQ